jgi:GNAT superfamily N-acetyltransferase
MVLWTDTRFDAAHRFYEKRGYVRQGAIRILDDLSKSLEFRYAKPAAGLVVEALDAAAAASAERRLAEILVASVAAGAGLGWAAPLAPDRARAVWKTVSTEVALGQRMLLGAWRDGALVGTIQLGLAMPDTGAHRATLSMLLVDPAFRRQGIGRALLARAVQAAQGIGRKLLVLETLGDDPALPLYHALGWRDGGRIPGHTLDPVRDGVTLYRPL